MTRLSVSSSDIWANVDFPDQIELGKQISFTKASNRPDAIAIALSIYSPDIYLSPEVAGPGGDRHKMTLQIGLSETSTSFSIPLSSWAEVPNKNKITFQVEAIAVSTSGIGTTANTTVYAVADQSLAPTFALDISPSSDVIQGVTSVSISISGESLKYGASVASRSINADGRSSGGTSLAITPTSSGAISVSATVKDSRGLSATKTATFNVTAYSPPALRSFDVSRVDSNGSSDAEGTSVKFAVVWESGSGDTGDNSCTVKYRQTGVEAYTDCGAVVSGQEYVITSDVFSTDFEYEFVAVVADKHNRLEKTVILEMAFFTLDFLAGGKGMAIGKPATHEGLDVGMEASFDRDVLHSGSIYIDDDRYVDSLGCWVPEPYYKQIIFRDFHKVANGYIEHVTQDNYHGMKFNFFKHTEAEPNGRYYTPFGFYVNNQGQVWYDVHDTGSFKHAARACGAMHRDGHLQIMDMDNSTDIWLRCTSPGFIPYNNDYGATDCQIGCGSSWQFSKIWGKEFYINGDYVADHVHASSTGNGWHYMQFIGGTCILYGDFYVGFTMKNWKQNTSSNAITLPNFPHAVYGNRVMLASPAENYAWSIVHNTEDPWKIGEIFLIGGYNETGYKEMHVNALVVGRWYT